MIVEDVELLHAGWSDDADRWTGAVSFRAKDDPRVVVQTDAVLPRHASAPSIRSALLDAAARQLRRMPEFRRNPERLIVPVEVMAIAAAR